MTHITDDLIIRGNRIKNRIVLVPMVTFSFRGDNGSYFGQQHVDYYTERAKGGTGLIIVQATRVLGAANATNMWSADNVASLRRIVTNCHSCGATIMIQLSCGDTDINQLSPDEISLMQHDMKQAALSACAIGFDGVEFHFAHGYTLCKFLDASYNKRLDQYGGDAVNRVRILTELLPEIRENTRQNFMIGVRMGEYLPSSQDGIEIAKLFEQAGIDLLHISFAMHPPTYAIPEGFKCSATTYSGCKMRRHVNIPVIAVNEIRTEEQVRFLIENNYVDFAGIGRAMFADPEFANHVIHSEPVNPCFGCGNNTGCLWLTNHLLCPATRQGY